MIQSLREYYEKRGLDLGVDEKIDLQIMGPSRYLMIKPLLDRAYSELITGLE
ncbi:MAG: hypothetical protein OXC82_05240 [Rhodobacteraceae bacterium]|nr:hypothetical protein [Paracoccaceae bacterium]MCY4249827.1 hypothetical protein [Paracoccaceae bacterium]MCY4307116.1 hypothetical protein [Paracoccaceae bacterium]